MQVFDEGSALIESGVCEAVLIATPHYQHPELSILAFQHNQHVMCEKPAGVYTNAVRRMNEKAAAHPHLSFGMMFNQRTNALYRKMHEMITTGQVGEIKRVNWIITDWYRTQFTMTPAPGAPPGRGRAAACCLTSARISWTCSSGCAACLKK